MTEQHDGHSRHNSDGLRTSAPRLPSLCIPDPNVFSDAYALEPLDSSTDSSPMTPIQRPTRNPETTLFSNHRSSINVDRSASNTSSRSTRPISTLKRPRENDDDIPNPRRSISMASNADSNIGRHSSTSSHFTPPRAQGPYVGATGPSHPYGLYPQVTRVSSIASTSTIRPAEQPFVSLGGPEHPYAMYSQNTVVEEENVPPSSGSIPLGFPGMGQAYQRVARTTDNDIADIVGADGHVEELPPYTRYPENFVPKDAPTLVGSESHLPPNSTDVPLSPQSTTSRFSDTGVVLNVGAARTAGSDSDGSFKERWKEKGKRRVLCGLPLWVALVFLAITILAGMLGVIIGSVVASRHSRNTDTPQAENLPSATAPSPTTWLDANPLPTGQYSQPPPIPTGQFNIPTGQNNVNSSSCIVDPALASAWGCLSAGGIGVTVMPTGGCFEVTFDGYTVNSSFIYGPQPPNLQAKSEPLIPNMQDKDATNLGPALFFADLYDKLVILTPDAIVPQPARRSIPYSDLTPRGYPNHRIAQSGDRPWFCWFNQTVIEMFIYVNETTSAYNSAYPVTSTAGQTTTTSSISSSIPTYSGYPYPTPYPTGWQPPRAKRQYSDWDWSRDAYPDYPLVVKLEEKRKPNSTANVQPYCEQMQVLDDGQIVSVGQTAVVLITEMEPSVSGTKIKERSADDGSIQSLGSSCVCEWMANG